MNIIRHKDGDIKVMFLNEHSNGKCFDYAVLDSSIKTVDPDVLVLAEHYYKYAKALNDSLQKRYTYSNDFFEAWKWDGFVYYSKLPMRPVVNMNRRKGYLDELFNTKIALGEDSLCLAACHLASNNVIAETDINYTIDSIKTTRDFFKYLKNISAVSKERKIQAEFLLEQVGDLSDTPAIILGDMNDVWGSGALRTFKRAGFRDAWWDGGFGYGATIHHPLPFRIDHILYNDKLKLRTIKRIKTHGLSDHDALVATFDLK